MMDWISRKPFPERMWDRLGERSVMLFGPRRAGKSTLLEHMAAHSRDDLRLVVVDLQGLDSVSGMVERVVRTSGGQAGLASLLTDRLESLEGAGIGVGLSRRVDEDPWVTLEAGLERISPADPASLVVIALDEVPWWLDNLERRAAGGARSALAQLRYLRGRFPNLRWLLTGSLGLAGPAISWGAAAELNDLDLEELGPMTPPQGRALFEMVCTAGNRLVERAATERAHELAGGLPHWIRVLGERVRSAEPGVVSVAQVELETDRLLSRANRHLFDEEGRVHFERRYAEGDRGLALAVLRSVASAGRLPRRGALAEAQRRDPTVRARFDRVVDRLVDEFYLVEDGDELRFLVPLMGRWFTRWG